MNWHRPDVETSVLDALTKTHGPISARQMVDGLISKGRAEPVAKLRRNILTALLAGPTDAASAANTVWTQGYKAGLSVAADLATAATRVQAEPGDDTAPDFFQPGTTYTRYDGTTFQCFTVTTTPWNGRLLAVGWHTDEADITSISWRDINAWNHEYDGVESPAQATYASTRGEPGDGA